MNPNIHHEYYDIYNIYIYIYLYISNHIPIQVDEEPESLNPIMNITINFHRMVINFESHPPRCEHF